MNKTGFTEQAIRNATWYVLKREYRPGILKSLSLIAVALVLVVSVFVSGLVSSSTMWGMSIGLGVAAIFVTIAYAVGSWQNLRFPLRVLHNEGTGEVGYELSEAGCTVRYKAVEITLPWKLLRMRDSCGEYEVLGFDRNDSDSDNAKAREMLDAMSRGFAGPEFLGFPIFCVMPRPRTRYLLIPAAFLRNNQSIPAI